MEVIHGVDLEIKDQEFVVFVGPSGCGKSTLLRMIAGLEDITAGEIYIGDTYVNDLHPADRGAAMVFQSYALYPHMSVRENIGFGLKLNKVPKAEIQRKVAEAAKILKIEELLDRRPAQLSGGQRQRVLRLVEPSSVNQASSCSMSHSRISMPRYGYRCGWS